MPVSIGFSMSEECASALKLTGFCCSRTMEAGNRTVAECDRHREFGSFPTLFRI